MELKRVVVTGMGAVTPLGLSAEETWKNMLAGVSGCDIIKQMDASRYKTQIACEVKDFDPTQWIDRKEARKMDKFCQMAVAGADMAIKDSGMDLETVDKDRIGVVYGVGIGGLRTMQEENLPIRSMCLSGHRKYPFGASDPAVRARGMEIMEKAILLADDLGVRIIQLAGYDVYYEEGTGESERLFRENLAKATVMAKRNPFILNS